MATRQGEEGRLPSRRRPSRRVRRNRRIAYAGGLLIGLGGAAFLINNAVSTNNHSTAALARSGRATPSSTFPLSPTTNPAAAVKAAVPGTTAIANRPALPDKPLEGRVIAVDAGHNGGNASASAIINQTIWNGRETETCDTTGTETDSGYTEAEFNYNVARYLTDDLEAEGAKVVLTRTSNTGVGPCVTERAAIGNDAHANAAISIHADGGPAWGRGFAVLEPVSDGINNAIIGPSQALAVDIRSAFLAGTGEPVSSYDGVNGLQPRGDLAGLNLSTVPKVLIECANMRNPTDAAVLTTAHWQQLAAQSLAAGLTAFLQH
jgi:N-acetylmuramoyl-L-alanine amidase